MDIKCPYCQNSFELSGDCLAPEPPMTKEEKKTFVQESDATYKLWLEKIESRDDYPGQC